jgi:C4-dicarboxylate-specific signal transduction histidine kinase
MRELSSLGRETRDATDRTDLRLVADRVRALRQYDLSRAQIAVDVSGDPGGVCTGAIDEQALMLVLSNLLLNAEQALIGQPDARIAISIHKQDGRVLVRVQDNGPGVSPEHQDRIFEPFYTTGRPGATLGLGLPVARMVVAEHGGQLRLASCADTGGGACFEIDLPAAG